MANNHLKLNDSKTECLIIARPSVGKEVEITSVKVGSSSVSTSHSASNIGACLDSQLNMEEQVNKVVQTCYGQLRQIGHIRQYLSQDSTAMLVNATITSRLDYMNSLLYGLPHSLLHKLELVQNNAARLVMRCGRREHVTPLLKTLHWLPISYRIEFKILLLVFKCLQNEAPPYLVSLLNPYQPSRTLRSSSQCLLSQPKSRLSKAGDRAFSVCAPRLWNDLPVAVRDCKTLSSFKIALKTHLFKIAFNCT